MYARADLERRDDRPTEDHIVRLSGATWDDYERLLEIRGDHSSPRITYLEGDLEIMSPSRDHERIKSFIGVLVEACCLARDIVFTPVGSWTLKQRMDQRGAEPDECYAFGAAPDQRPDLAIEVFWTSGRIDKLEVYRKLDVREVWICRQGHIEAYALRGDTYERISGSEVLPGIDLDQLTDFLDRPTAYDAIRDYRAALEK